MEAEGRFQKAEGTIQELRKQIEEADADFDESRIKLDQEREAKVKAETQLEETKKHLEDEKRFLEEAKTRLTDTFKALAGDTLNTNNEKFLTLAHETFSKILTESKGDLEQRKTAIDGLVKPLSDTLKRIEENNKTLEENRQKAYGGLQETLNHLTETQKNLHKETGNLVSALRTPQVRGKWGEITLRKTVELAGMSRHCDFTEQITVQSGEGRIRPDLIIHLPAKRDIVVDSKVALDAYSRAIEQESEEERNNLMDQHSKPTREHLKTLGANEQFEQAPEFVVMFVPGESFLQVALDRDPSLFEDAIRAKIILASPTNLIGLLLSIAYGWRQEQIAQNAKTISDLGKELHERMNTLVNYLNEIEKNLNKALDSYNKATRSIESRCNFG